jgi:hypothetical protein
MQIVVPTSSNYWIFNLCARHHTLTVTIPIFLIFKRNFSNRHSGATANPPPEKGHIQPMVTYDLFGLLEADRL